MSIQSPGREKRKERGKDTLVTLISGSWAVDMPMQGQMGFSDSSCCLTSGDRGLAVGGRGPGIELTTSCSLEVGVGPLV